jgi:hypothetical protein
MFSPAPAQVSTIRIPGLHQAKQVEIGILNFKESLLKHLS